VLLRCDEERTADLLVCWLLRTVADLLVLLEAVVDLTVLALRRFAETFDLDLLEAVRA
jgi:hypothetical protein